jgi:four helix bundle protein
MSDVRAIRIARVRYRAAPDEPRQGWRPGCSTVLHNSSFQWVSGNVRNCCVNRRWPDVAERARRMSDSPKTYRDLDAWKLAMAMVETTYALTRLLPDSERFNLIHQMQKSATSVPSNIAEGQARGTVRFGLWFLRVAIGSTAELDTQVELARRLKYVTVEATRELDSQLERVRQMLYGMRREHQRRLAAVGATVVSLFLLLRSSGFFA